MAKPLLQKDFPQKELLEQLLSCLNLLQREHLTLLTKDEKTEFNNLMLEINKITQQTIDLENQYNSCIKRLEATLLHQVSLSQQAKPGFLPESFFHRRPQNEEDLIESLNTNMKTKHCIRIISLLLKYHYNYTTSENVKSMQIVQKVRYPDESPYHQLTPLAVIPHHKPLYDDISQSLQKLGVSPTKIYYLYQNEISLDISLAKTVWPELKNKYYLTDKEIQELLDNNPIHPELLEHAASHAISSVGIKYALPEVFPAPPDPEAFKKWNENRKVASIETESRLKNIQHDMQSIKTLHQELKDLHAKRILTI